jgi:hypothetical protein
MATSFFYRAVGSALLLAGSSLLLLSGCKQACEQNLPTYRLSAAQLSWRGPYVPDTVWRFRNAAGYERRYRITSVETELPAKGSSKSSLCNTYYREQYTANLGRTDSTQTANFNAGKCQLFMEAELPGNTSSTNNDNVFQWNGYSFYVPTDEVAAGQYPLTTATFGSRTYANVITSNAATNSSPPIRLRVFLTVANGVVAFDDVYGNLWVRR